jgi:hypothetical protein
MAGAAVTEDAGHNGTGWRGAVSLATFSLRTALEAVSHNRLRAALTSLGILFGVASVIAMLVAFFLGLPHRQALGVNCSSKLLPAQKG